MFVAQGPTRGQPTTLYEATQQTGNITFVKQGGVTTGLGQVGLPSSAANYNQGTFGDGATADTLYVRLAQTDRRLYAVNVPAKTTQTIVLSADVPNLSDFAWADGYLWGVDGPDRRMYRIDPGTGAVVSFAVTGVATDPYGAQWTYGNGNIGISDNVTGTVYQLRLNNPTSATPTATVLSATRSPTT
ncbi:hypothetical protein GCM10009839_08070 [Catenulispora yoronensis]|uniref:DUF6923 domain-containing protein n=1 Tax=Catenulispora yoronensis TaxID=450799 RepID=A0ABP5F7B8_9ACTN